MLAFILAERGVRLSKRLWIAAAYCAATASVVAMAYWLCYEQANHPAYPTLTSWVASYASDSNFTRSLGDVFAHYAVSYLKLFAGGKLTLLRDYFSVPVVLALALCVGLLVSAGRLFFKRSNRVENQSVNARAALFLWTWLIAYALFLGIWDPGSAFHKLFIWPPIVLLIGIYVARGTQLKAATVLAGALAAWNFAAFIYPHSRASADPVLSLALRVNRELPKNASVYFAVLDPDDWYLQYFAPGRQWLNLPGPVNDSVLLPAAHGPVCLETTALAGFHGDIDPNLKWDLVNSQHNIRLECLKAPKF